MKNTAKKDMSEKMTEKKDNIRNSVGNAVEKAGHKLSEAGHPKLGKKVHDVGDKIEKKHRNTQHPHTV